MVLQDVGIALLHRRDETRDQARLVERARVDAVFPAGTVTQADHEDAIALLVETRGFEIELQAMHVLEPHALEVGAARQRQKLLDRVAHQDQPAKVVERPRIAAVALAGHLQELSLIHI